MTKDTKFEDATRQVVTQLEHAGNKVQVIGHIKDGKIELDQESLKEMAAKFPGRTMAFVAVNAPFDPVRT